MTDEEVEDLLPAVEEFIDVVVSRDPAGVEACLRFTAAPTLAIILAELLNSARLDLGRANYVLKMTDGIEPAGLNKYDVWRIATERHESASENSSRL